MKNYLIMIFVCFIIGCSKMNNIEQSDNYNIEYGASMIETYNKTFSITQFDSICEIDSLPALNAWYVIPIVNREIGLKEYEYSFIKSLGTNQIIYRVEQTNSPDSVRITKRITK